VVTFAYPYLAARDEMEKERKCKDEHPRIIHPPCCKFHKKRSYREWHAFYKAYSS